MALITPPSWQQVGSYSAKVLRLVFNDMFSRSGTLSLADLKVSVPVGGSSSLTVDKGSVFIKDEDPGRGGYHVTLDESITLPLIPYSGTGSRTDGVYVVIHDSTLSGSSNKASIELVLGTGGTSYEGSPPANSLKLATVQLTGGNSIILPSAITDKRVNALVNSFMLSGKYQTQPGEWTTLTPATNWSTYSTAYYPLQARLFDKIVELRGLVRWSGALITTGSNVKIATLPAKFQPPKVSIGSVLGRVAGYTSDAASAGTAHTHTLSLYSVPIRISIDPGNASGPGIYLLTGGSYAQTFDAGPNQWVAFDGVFYGVTN